MNILKEDIIRALPPFYSTQSIPLKDIRIICKFYIPDEWSWYVFEGEIDAETGYRFFGMVVNGENEKELGYFSGCELVELIAAGNTLFVQYDPTFNTRYSDIFSDSDKFSE